MSFLFGFNSYNGRNAAPFLPHGDTMPEKLINRRSRAMLPADKSVYGCGGDNTFFTFDLTEVSVCCP
jgi:hypothetical protein